MEEKPKRGRPKKQTIVPATKTAEVVVVPIKKEDKKKSNVVVKKEKPKKEPTIIVWTSGRRKTAVAGIKLLKNAGAVITVNTKDYKQYFPALLEQQELLSPFKATGRNLNEFEISIKALGGGKKAQLEACVLGIAKALLKVDPNLRPTLKKGGFLTRDPRMTERKKYGLRRARRAPQFSKR